MEQERLENAAKLAQAILRDKTGNPSLTIIAKPLHVRVAEALGVRHDYEYHDRDEAPNGESQCTRCRASAGWSEALPDECAPRYDTDWAATGPLIERYGIALVPPFPDPVTLQAVCNLILALHAAGKLDLAGSAK